MTDSDMSAEKTRDGFVKPAAGDEKTYSIVSLPEGFLRLPPEILHMIFERTIPPHFLLDPSEPDTFFSPMSLWSKVLRQKKSLINVCRAWYHVGLPFLYADVVILHVPQFSRLLRTLKVPDNRDYGRLIKSTTFYCHIPREIQLTFESKLALFLPLCPNATSFTFQPPVDDDYWTSFDTLTSSFNHITRLSVDNIDIVLAMRMVQISALKLVSLYLGPLLFRFRNSTYQELSSCLLPCLEELSIPGTGYLDINFTMPRLTRLTILHHHGINSHILGDSILHKHGAQLKYLHISPKFEKRRIMNRSYFDAPNEPWVSGEVVQSLLDLCPSLEHVVLHLRATEQQLTHPKVKWVDIWEPIQCEPPHAIWGSPESISNWFTLRRSITKDAFPSLQAVRQISSAFYDFPDLPSTFFPPGRVRTASDAFAYAFLDMDVHHDVARIYGHISHLTVNWPEGYTSDSRFSFYSHDEPVEGSDDEHEERDVGEHKVLEAEDAGADLALEDSDGDANDSEDGDSDYLDLEGSSDRGGSSSDSDSDSDSDLSDDGSNSIDWEVTPGERLVTITDLDWRELVEND